MNFVRTDRRYFQVEKGSLEYLALHFYLPLVGKFFEKLPKLHLRLIYVNIKYLTEILGCHQIDLYRLMMLNNFNYAPELAEWIILKALHSTILSYDYVKFGKKLIRQ